MQVIDSSIVNVGQLFWGYGWEIQLLETGMMPMVEPLTELTLETPAGLIGRGGSG